MNSLPLSLWSSKSGNGRVAWMVLRPSRVHLWALFFRVRSSVQPEATSVAVRVKLKSPASLSPQWWTVSVWK
jgi:hypothetical protein